MENSRNGTAAVSPGIAAAVHNSPRDMSLRRAQNTLIIVGTGTILFGLWSVVKTVGVILINRREEVAMIRENSQIPEALAGDGVMFAIVLVISAIILLIDLALRLFVGRSAIAEAQGRRCSFLYIPVTVLMILSGFATVLFEVYVLFFASPDSTAASDVSLASVIIELTSMLMMIKMVSDAHSVRKYRKQQASSGE